jgi:hypothetical protein
VFGFDQRRWVGRQDSCENAYFTFGHLPVGGFMVANSGNENEAEHSKMSGSVDVDRRSAGEPISDDEVQHNLDHGDKEKIDKNLDELGVSKTSSGKDQTAKPDTEGSNSSSKNLDEQED